MLKHIVNVRIDDDNDDNDDNDDDDNNNSKNNRKVLKTNMPLELEFTKKREK